MPVNLDSDLLRTFVAIADSGSFTRAAQLVNRTQSAVSMQIKRLQEIIGKPLFARDGRVAMLTAEGEALLAYARRILKLHDEAVSTLRQPDVVGAVRVGTPDDYALRFLPDILARFARAYPRVQVAVRCEPSSKLMPALDQGELDLALITCSPGAESGEILRREPTVWASSERHLAHEQEPLPLALFPAECIFRSWALNALDKMGRNYRIAYSSPSITGLLAAVVAGLAVTVLGRSILPPGVKPLGPKHGFPQLPASAITLHRAPTARSQAVQCLANHIVEGFRME